MSRKPNGVRGYKTVKHKTPDVALIYICERRIINPYDVIESEYMPLRLHAYNVSYIFKTCSRDSGMMHNDLHSGNVMFDPETNSLTLIDYGE
jgi:thiamine kinase-like enzyme